MPKGIKGSGKPKADTFFREVVGTEWRNMPVGDQYGKFQRKIMERLSCGHYIEPRKDIFGRSESSGKRRCKQCMAVKADMARAGRI